jgi:hypothetical protein
MTPGHVVIVVAVLSAFAGGFIGRAKGSSFSLWFLIAGLFPLAGLLTVICYRWESRELRRQCPGCGRIVKLHDALCTSCGTELEFPSVAIASEAAMHDRAA